MRVSYIPDPKLLFYNNNPALDPCHGLSVYGAYGLKLFKDIKIAIIGSNESISQVEDLIFRLKDEIPHSDFNKWPFPGIGKDSILRIDFRIIRKGFIDKSDLEKFEKNIPPDRIERIRNAISLIESEIKKIYDTEPNPDLIILSIPNEILKSCRSKEFKHTNRIYLLKKQFEPGLKDVKDGYNFHHIIKIIGMEKRIPIQLIFPDTLVPNPKIKGRQDLSMIAWNLTVALLYKSNEIPWKYFQFPDSTCFVGISFHKDFDENDKPIMRASIAQTFLSDGRDIVLRGKQFKWDDRTKKPHMSEDYTIELAEKILVKYKQHWNRYPERVVIHKSSFFTAEEEDGFKEAFNDIQKYDLVNIKKTKIKFFRLEQQPVVRGSLIEMFGKFYLYNVGYVPCLKEYPGSRIPTPVEIVFHKTDTNKKKLCEEIMALSRLNWNNIDYSTRYPVTLTFSRNVGEILSEYRAKSLNPIPDKYRFYM